MILFEDFILRALAAGLGVALVAGPLGCFVVWRRMAYFGDTMAHAALTGVALGLLFGITPVAGIVGVGVVLVLFLTVLGRRGRHASDTLLGIFSHGALSVGVILLATMESVRVDLMAYLFGDILAVMPADLAWIWGGGLTALAMLVVLWRPLLATTVSPEVAQAEGVPVLAVQVAFMLLIALVVAVAMKIIGVLLITAMLIIPAAAARRFAASPEAMAVFAAGIGAVAVVLGLVASARWDTPAGPSVVAAAVAVFAVSPLAALLTGRRG
ncbi:metal ABC transporter permease [Caenispirillum bisanense]|uniref:High-affinity zinc uptake system membrane protein ZnuB n=1 Tax=Caenispirillum bisanense TaxID=414052 RepID=A0A286GNJ4_9PROT|nr:metal ABC transporter permease [Caenispirillum bisanense]SOD97072.1 zinc transport system permease protein [Caenispirillum bisanense]